MDNNHKIAILVPWFGSWPGWTRYFIQSCAFNPEVHWFIFSDHALPVSLPQNISCFRISLAELVTRINTSLHIKSRIIHPYKLVDFKPAFGVIFQQYITGYHFWGYSDTDVLYGKLTHFLTDELLNHYDIISPSIDFIPGHFCLFRNKPLLNRLFMKSLNWEHIFSSPKCYCFDEKLLKRGFEITPAKIRQIIRRRIQNHLIEYRLLRNPLTRYANKYLFRYTHNKLPNSSELTDFNKVIAYFSHKEKIEVSKKQWFKDDMIKILEREKVYQILWIDGRLYDGEKEIMYFHFQLSKYSDSFRIFQAEDKKNHIYVINSL